MGVWRTDEPGRSGGRQLVSRHDEPKPPDRRQRAVALIDGEHYPPVVRAALERLAEDHEVVQALFLGGREKLRGGDAPGETSAYGVSVECAEDDVIAALARAVRTTQADVVVDLSDEPVVGYVERFGLMSAALAAGAGYIGADFELRPQPLRSLPLPTLAVIGTGKRVGKTAVSGRLARLVRDRLSDPGRVVVVAMGRGGPPEPELVRGDARLGVEELLEVSRRGRHAASDHYEDAVLTGVPTIGARRCGGGLAGAAFQSNVDAAFDLLARTPAAVAIVEGSGSVIPPAVADATLCVASAAQPHDYVTGFLGTYRLLIADLLVLTLCEPPFVEPGETEGLRAAIRRVRPDLPVVATVFRPRPQIDIGGRRIAYFTTATADALPALRAHLSDAYGAEVVVATADLADRPRLATAIGRARKEADLWLTEIKAAAVDVVAEAAADAGATLVFCDNEAWAVGDDDLSTALDSLVQQGLEAAATRLRQDPPPEVGSSTTTGEAHG